MFIHTSESAPSSIPATSYAIAVGGGALAITSCRNGETRQNGLRRTHMPLVAIWWPGCVRGSPAWACGWPVGRPTLAARAGTVAVPSPGFTGFDKVFHLRGMEG